MARVALITKFLNKEFLSSYNSRLHEFKDTLDHIFCVEFLTVHQKEKFRCLCKSLVCDYNAFRVI